MCQQTKDELNSNNHNNFDLLSTHCALHVSSYLILPQNLMSDSIFLILKLNNLVPRDVPCLKLKSGKWKNILLFLQVK